MVNRYHEKSHPCRFFRLRTLAKSEIKLQSVYASSSTVVHVPKNRYCLISSAL